jgi:hypothetical protein
MVEWYCEDSGCDCRRVLVRITPSNDVRATWATINYGWEPASFYEKWTGSREMAEDIVGASLDPINPQSRYADAFLEVFQDSVAKNPSWPQRFAQHYELFKSTLGASSARKESRRERRARLRSERRS